MLDENTFFFKRQKSDIFCECIHRVAVWVLQKENVMAFFSDFIYNECYQNIMLIGI